MRCFALAAASLGLVLVGMQLTPVAAQTEMAQTDMAQADTTGTLPVAAKPADFASKEEEAGIEQSFALLREELAENEVAQPAQAIAQYEAFFNLKGKRSVRVGIAISSLIAKLYWLGLHQPQKAQATYDWAIATYRNQPGFERLYLEEQLLQNPKALDVKQVKSMPNLKAPLVPDAVKVASQVQAKAPVAVATVRVGQPTALDARTEVARVVALEGRAAGSVDMNGVVVGGAPVAFGVPLVATVTMPKPADETPNRAQVAQIGGTQTATTTRMANIGAVRTPAVGTAQGKTLEVATVSSRSALLVALVEQMRAGVLTPEEAWKNGNLTVDDAMQVLNQSGDWIVTEVQHDNGMYRALVGVLIEHGSEKLKDISKMPSKARLWLADYFQVNKDRRAVLVLENILDEIQTRAPEQAKEDMALVFQSVERLAWLHRDAGQHEKAAQTWLRMKTLPVDEGMVTDSCIEAARLYLRVGDRKKASELYVFASESKDEFLAGGALREYARVLIQQGEQRKAQHLLEQVLKQLKPEGTTKSRHVVASSFLGYLHYLEGEWPQSRSYYQQGIAQSEKISVLQVRASVEEDVSKARDMLRLIEQWQQQPIVCDPSKIEIIARSDLENELVTRRFLVSLFRDVPLQVTSSNPDITARVEDSPWVEDEQPLQFEKQIALEIAPATLQKSFKATVTISSPQLPGFMALVPVHVEVRKP